MDEGRFEEQMAEWASREEAAAPDLRPPEDLRRRVQALRRRSVRLIMPGLARWTLAAACLLGVAALAWLLLPSLPPPPALHLQVVAWQPGDAVTVEGPALAIPKGGRGGGPKGPKSRPPKGIESFAQLLIQVHREGTSEVKSIDLLTPRRDAIQVAPGDRYRLGWRVGAPRHCYLFQVDARGGLTRLFPEGGFSGKVNPLQPGQAVYLPGEPGWFSLQDARGPEWIHVVSSTQPLTEVDAIYGRYREARDRGEGEAIASLLREHLESLRRERPADVDVIAIPLNDAP